MQVVFHAEMERENGSFDFSDVADGVCKKLIERHPHVFGDTEVSSTDEVLSNWDAIKSKSKKRKPLPIKCCPFRESFRHLCVHRSFRKRRARWASIGPM